MKHEKSKHEADSTQRSSFLPSVVGGGSQTQPTIDESNVLNDSSCMMPDDSMLIGGEENMMQSQ